MLPDSTPTPDPPHTARRTGPRGTSTAPGRGLRGWALLGLALAVLPTVYAVATRDGRFGETQAGSRYVESEQPFAGPEPGAAPAVRTPHVPELEAQGGARAERSEERLPQQPGL